MPDVWVEAVNALQEARTVRCPRCGGDSVYAPSNRYRPFCSERCKQIDLGAWANEDFKVASPEQDPLPDHNL